MILLISSNIKWELLLQSKNKDTLIKNKNTKVKIKTVNILFEIFHFICRIKL